MEAMWERIAKNRANVLPEKPKDSFTIDEFCSRFKITRSAGASELRRLEKQGRLIARDALLTGSNGYLRRLKVYTEA